LRRWFDGDRGPWGQWRSGRGVRLGTALIWLGFVVFPVVNAFTNRGSALRHVLAISGALTFVAAYVALIVCWRSKRKARLAPALFVVLIAVATALTLGDRPGWGFLFIYCAACTALIAAPAIGFASVVGFSVLAGGVSALGGASGGTALGFVTSCLGIGLLMLLMRDLRVRNDELNRARAELARLAVAEERARFARDLHDLLGHTLSVIALKAELAGRLLPGQPDQARREIADVEEVVRNALSEVRQAASGYRQPTLDGELAGARMALVAARIEPEFHRPAVTLDPAVEAVLAWTVREGVTNVIRHSRSRRCVVRITADGAHAGVEILDDGVGAGLADDAGVGSGEGSGLAGLGERVGAVGGQLEAGDQPDHGFRLAVTIPVAPVIGSSGSGSRSGAGTPELAAP
jgi:two-component system sensor histidine kinase DesK